MAEPPPPPSIPARLLGRGARAVGGVAGATGLDRAVEDAIADAVVRAIESPAFDRAFVEVIDGPVIERAVSQAMQSESVERAITEAIDSEMIDRVWERLLASDEIQKTVERIAEAPEIRAAIASQGVGLIGDLGRKLGMVARRMDDVVERIFRRLTFKPQRTERTNFAGLVTRGLAIGVDAAILSAVVFGVTALLGFAVDAIFPSADLSGAKAAAIGASTWLFFAAIYLVGFWSFEGETPGMRFIGLNLEEGGTPTLGFRRSVKRLVWLGLSFFPLFGLPFLGIARNDERRALHDRRAGTDVIYVAPKERAAPWTFEGQPGDSKARPAARGEEEPA